MLPPDVGVAALPASRLVFTVRPLRPDWPVMPMLPDFDQMVFADASNCTAVPPLTEAAVNPSMMMSPSAVMASLT